LEELAVFVMVVEANGFSAAANRLDTTAAAVSRRIKALEQRLGVRLLQRTTRSVELTEAGELYYREVRRILDDLQTAEDQIQHNTVDPTGELRIAAPMSYGQQVLAPLVARFALAHPRLRVSLWLEDSETDLARTRSNLALRISYPHDASYIAKPIKSIPRYLCASPHYLAQHGTPLHPRDLLQHRCLHYNLISESEEWTFESAAGTETLAVKGVFCSNNGEALCEAAIQGLGITFLPDFIVTGALADGRLVRVLEHYERTPLTLFAVYLSRHFVPAKVRLFIDFMVGALN